MKTLGDSLAANLGIQDPRQKDPGEPVPYTPPKTAKEYAESIIFSREYRDHMMRMVITDSVPPALGALLHHYALGKPTEQIEVKDTTIPLEDRSVAELTARADFLLSLARQKLRTNDDAPTPSEEVSDDGLAPSSVH